MRSEADIAQRLVEAQRAGSRSVDQGLLQDVYRAAAYRIQAATMSALGMAPAMFKVAVAPDGSGTIAPIYGGRVGQSGALTLAADSVTGLEVEIGVVLGRDLPAGADAATVDAAIVRYFAGMEVCGTRYADRTAAAYDAGLADNMSAFGYVLGNRDWERGIDLDDLTVELRFNDEAIYSAPAKHGFGGVLAAVHAYARLKEQPYPLTAGTILTTGSLCGLVPTSGPGKAVASIGGHAIEVELS